VKKFSFYLEIFGKGEICMINYYSFDVFVKASEIENLFADCIIEGFSGCSEVQEDEEIRVSVCYDNECSANEARESLLQNYRVSPLRNIENRDWNEEWKKTVTPVKITDKIWVSPKWLEPKTASGESWIKIEPRMAFGTGHHETTRIAAKLLEQNAGKKTLLDIGTGSGILAFVAQNCGYKSITGIEIDEDCKINLSENLEDNRAKADIRFIIGGIEKIGSSAKFDAVIMNMISSQSVPLLRNICAILHKGGTLFWSGILETEKNYVIEQAQKVGFELRSEITENEWWGAKFTMK
jgi:ribosomal protein L11 methyltransferase